MEVPKPAAILQYFRRDQSDGVTAPDLRKTGTYAEHIVRARGKRTQLTSVSSNLSRVKDFGDTTYRLKRPDLDADGHLLIEHQKLLDELRKSASTSLKEERARAIQALRYAERRSEGLIEWKFDTSGVEPKDAITWAFNKIQKYFTKQ